MVSSNKGRLLTRSAADVIEGLGDILRHPLREPEPSDYGSAPAISDESGLVAVRKTVEDALGPTPVPVDEIVRQCQFSPAVVAMVLLEMELAGRLERHPGGQVARKY